MWQLKGFDDRSCLYYLGADVSVSTINLSQCELKYCPVNCGGEEHMPCSVKEQGTGVPKCLQNGKHYASEDPYYFS